MLVVSLAYWSSLRSVFQRSLCDVARVRRARRSLSVFTVNVAFLASLDRLVFVSTTSRVLLPLPNPLPNLETSKSLRDRREAQRLVVLSLQGPDVCIGNQCTKV